MADPVKPGEVVVYDRLGRRFVGPETGLRDAMQRGFRQESPDEAQARIQEEKFGDRPIAAGAAGAARAATLGLSDLGLTQSGLVEGETLRGLREANEGASIAGEVIGTGVSLLTPGLGVANVAKGAMKAGQLAERGAALLLKEGAETFAGKLATKAAGGIVEGSLYGAGSALTEASLGDEELTAEKLLSHMGLGAVFGGGAAGSLEAILSRRLLLGGAKAAAGTADNFAPGLLDDAAESAIPDAAKAGADDGASFADALREGFSNPKLAGETLEKGAKENVGVFKGLIEDLGLGFPTAEGWTLRGLDIKSTGMKNLRKTGRDVSAPKALLEDPRYAAAKTLDDQFALVQTKKAEAGNAISESVRKFDELAEAGERINLPDVVQRIRDEVLAPLERGSAGNKPIAERVLKEIDLLEHNPGSSFDFAEGYKRDLDKFINWKDPAAKPQNEALADVRRILNDEIEKRAEALQKKVGGDVFDQWKKAKRSYGDMSELESAVAPRVDANGVSNRYFSLTDNLAGGAGLAAGGLSPLGLAAAGGAALLNKWGRERLPQIIALQLKAMRENPGGFRVAKSFHESIENLLKRGPDAPPVASAAPGLPPTPGMPGMAQAGAQAATEGAFGRFTAPLSAAAARGVASLWATHHALASLEPEYPATMQQAGFPMEQEGGVLEVMRKAQRLDEVQASVDAQNARIDKALEGFLDGKKPAVKVSSVGGLSRVNFGLDKAKAKGVKAYEARLSELARLAQDPEALTEALSGVTGPLVDSAPGVATAMAAAAARAAAFLHEKAPKPPPEVVPGIQALARKWQPSDQELSRWERYMAAVAEPEGVLRDLRAGTVTREAVESLKAVYPKLHADLQARMMERLAGRDSPLDYGKRLTLSSLFGVPLDEAMKPERVAALQASFAQAQQPQAPAGRRIDVAGGEMTQAQRLEARGA